MKKATTHDETFKPAPTVLKPNFPGVPALLQSIPQWLVWMRGQSKTDGSGRYDKLPANAISGKACNAHDPENWLTFEKACHVYEPLKFAGIAFDLPNERKPIAYAEDGAPLFLIGGDIDTCISIGEDGKPALSADAGSALLRLGRPYYEMSPSGTGLRFFCLYRKPLATGNRAGKELYSGGRFLTVTGHGSGVNVREVGPELEELHREWFGAPQDYFSRKQLLTSGLTSAIGQLSDPETPERLEVIKKQLSFISPENYKVWVDVGMALHSTGWQSAYSAWEDWSRTSAKFDEHVQHGKWDSFALGGGITLGTIHHLAMEGGWTPPKTTTATTAISETLNDAGNADRFISKYSNAVRYVVELKTWMFWHQGRWNFDKKGNVIQLALNVVRSIFIEAGDQTDTAKAKALSNHANASLQKNRLEALVALAATNPKITVSVAQLDANPWMLGLKNGLIDLRTGAFCEARPEDLITRFSDVEYVAGAKCPVWESTVSTCFGGNQSMVDFYQRAIGYTATGSTREQVFFFQFGRGRNGKSTLLNAVREILGGYSAQINPEILMMKRGGNASGATPELVRLKNVRLAAATETEDGQRLAEAFIKQVTGGEPIEARPLYGNPFEYVPLFKLWLSGNHRPIIRGEDFGIWRRIILINFTIIFTDEQLDKTLPDKLRGEYSGILNWIIQGAQCWQRLGLNPPGEIAREVEAYKSEMDLVKQWMDEWCDVKPIGEYPARQAYVSFSSWCKEGGHTPVAETRFAQKMEQQNIQKKKKPAGMRYCGITPRYPGQR